MKKENGKTNSIINKVKEVYSLMCNSNISEIELTLEEFIIKIKRFTSKDNNKLTNEVTHLKNLQLEDKMEKDQPVENPRGEEITSPLNGVFYRSPSPGALPFVEEGSVVEAGSTLCIIEAMKVMNEIKADKKCKILKVLCENGSNVSAGTKLFIVEKY
ncbi:MAG: acetyl-CoA carboxylase, biotin carboxyl carrier protein [Endomicrobia bacterium]|nr:acetyl-CoA carboxylase, biotin carboxyl carrier protein [Endomicrobiia bacterium]